MKAILKTNIIITQKKPRNNAEVWTITPLMSLLGSRGGDGIPFGFFIWVVWVNFLL